MGERKQNSSCDECRKARLGCNALSNTRSKCSNCKRRNRSCTRSWVEQHQRRRPNNARNRFEKGYKRSSQTEGSLELDLEKSLDGGSPGNAEEYLQHSQSSSILPSGQEQVTSRRQQSSLLHQKLWAVFSRTFEARVSLWLTNGCCPYKNPLSSWEPNLTISQVVARLDSETEVNLTPYSMENLDDIWSQGQENDVIHKALVNAVHAFSIRWLLHNEPHASRPLAAHQNHENISIDIWEQAHQSMYTIMSKPSFRSVLALQLFGMTPVPLKNEDKGINDLCTEIALNQQNVLRSRHHRNNQDFEKGLMVDGLLQPPTLDSHTTQRKMSEHSYLQDLSFWFSVTCDTSRSLSQGRPSILLDNQNRYSAVWDAVKQNVDDFDFVFQPLRHSREPLSDEVASIILQHASAAQKMFSSIVAQTRDSIYHPVNDCNVEAIISNAFQQLHYLETVFDLHLDQCARDFMLLNEENQFSYLLLVIHFHMTALILVDSSSHTMNSHSSTWAPQQIRKRSSRDIVNAANLALQLDKSNSTTGPQSSIFLLDPNPNSLVLAFSRAGLSILILYDRKELSARAVNCMLSIIFTSLEVVSRICPTANDTLFSLKESLSKLNLNGGNSNISGAREYDTSQGNVLDILEHHDRKVTNEVRDGMVLQLQPKLTSPNVPKESERSGAVLFDDISPLISDVLSQDWTLQDYSTIF